MNLPEDLQAERALLSTLGASGTLDPGSENADAHRAVLGIRPEHLHHPGHRAMLAAIQTLYQSAAPVDSIAIKVEMERAGTLGKIGGFTGIVEVLGGEEVLRPTRLVDRLLDLWRQRQVIALGSEAQKRGQDATEDVGDVISALATRLSTLATGVSTAALRKGSALIDRVMSGLAFRDSSHGVKLAHLGLPSFDDVLECSAGHVVTVAARPGVGKSALGVQMVWKSAEHGARPMLVSLEMDADEIDARLASWRSGLGYKNWREGNWTTPAAQSIVDAAGVLDRIVTWCHPSGVSWSAVEAAIRDAVRLHGVTTVVIDHALLVAKPNAGKGANDAACWAVLSRGIKRLAQELRICIVPLLQLNRGGAEGEPRLDSMRESGAWEEDANAVLMIWPKEATSTEEFVESRAVYMKPAKNRSGASGWKRELDFRGATNRFTEIERTTEPAPVASCTSGFYGD